MSVAPTQDVPARTGFCWPLALLASIAAAGVYVNSLHNPFVYDDHRLILENDSLTALPNLYAIAVHEVTRPLVNLTYAIDWSVWGLTPFGFHLTNVLLHVVNVGLVFYLVWHLTRDASVHAGHSDAISPNIVAGTAALMLAVNPMMTQAVGYISGRSELLCATFLLFTFLAARQFLATTQAGWALGTIGLWTLAMLCKEVAAVAPLVLIAYDRWVARPSPVTFRVRVTWLYGPMALIMAVAIGIRVWVLRSVEYPADALDPTYALVELEAIRRYATLLLGQGPQSIFHHIQPFDSWLSVRAIATMATLPATVIAVWWLHRRQRLVAFGLVWFLLLLLPSSVLFVLGRGEAMAEHRAYGAGIGFFLALGALIGRLATVIDRQPRRTRLLARVVAVVILAQLAMHTVLRNAVWSSPVTLWQDAVVREPGHWLPRLMLGEAFREAGLCQLAIPEYQRAIRGNPDEALAYAHLGSCLIATQDLPGALTAFTTLKARYPESADAAAGLGLLAVGENRLDEGQSLLREALRRDTRNAPVRQLLVALEDTHQTARSSTLCRQINALAPSSKMARACTQSAGDTRP